MSTIRWYAARLGYIAFGAAGALAVYLALDGHTRTALSFAFLAVAAIGFATVHDDPPRG